MLVVRGDRIDRVVRLGDLVDCLTSYPKALIVARHVDHWIAWTGIIYRRTGVFLGVAVNKAINKQSVVMYRQGLPVVVVGASLAL